MVNKNKYEKNVEGSDCKHKRDGRQISETAGAINHCKAVRHGRAVSRGRVAAAMGVYASGICSVSDSRARQVMTRRQIGEAVEKLATDRAARTVAEE